jgi:branched-chain amino acid transport system permease protein
MSSRRSDSIALGATKADGSAVGFNARSAWWETLKANWLIPIALIALIGIGRLLIENNVINAYYQRVVMLIGFNIILAVSLQLINGFSGQFSLGHAGFMAVGAYMAAYPAKEYSQRLADPAAALWFFIVLGVLVAVVGFALLVLFWGLRASRKIHRALPAVLMLVLIAWWLVDIAKASQYDRPHPMFIWTHVLSAIRRGFETMLAHGMPMATKLSATVPTPFLWPISFLVLVIGAGACAAVVGLIVGMPALRLRGDYLAIATLGLAEIIRIMIQNSPALGGALGITNIPKATDFGWLSGWALVTVIVIWRIAYSSKGRAIMAVREDEIAAAACGIDTTRYKVTEIVIGAFFAGVAGALFSLHERSITPGYFSIAKSIEVVVMVTLGGLGSISGAILAAIVLTILPELLRNISPEVADYRMIIYSLLLVIMMLLRPQGLLGGRELWFRRGFFRSRNPVPTEDRDDFGGTIEEVGT